MEERIKNLEGHVQRLRNIVWVVGVVAIVFGVSGGWGITTLNKSKEEIKTLTGQIKQLNNDTNKTKESFAQLRQKEEKAFGEYVTGQKSILSEYIRGAIVPFESNKCPDGWVEYPKAYGRFIRGIDKSQNLIDPDGQRKPGNLQRDLYGKHSHKLFSGQDARNWATVTSENYATVQETLDNSQDYQIKGSNVVPDRAKSSEAGGSESRPKNVALLYCIKE